MTFDFKIARVCNFVKCKGKFIITCYLNLSLFYCKLACKMAEPEKLKLLRKKLIEVNCPYYNVSDEDLLTMLFVRNDFFESLLHWSLIQMDSEYEAHLRNCPDRKKEIMTILNRLQLTRDQENISFLLGTLSKPQQLDVWLRLFATVEYVTRYNEDPVDDLCDIQDIIFKEKNTKQLSSLYCLPNNKVQNLQEIELLLQDAEDKLEQLEIAIGDQKTTEVFTFYQKPETAQDMEKIVTLLHEKLGEFRESLANYMKKPANRDSNLQQSNYKGEIISVTKIKELGEKLSAGNLFLSNLNDHIHITGKSDSNNEPEEKLDVDELCNRFSEICDMHFI